MLSSRKAAHRDPLAPELLHGHPVRGHPLPSPEHLSSCTEPPRALTRCSRFASPRCVPRGCVARTRSPCLCSAALITRRRFLQARHPSSSSSLERWTHGGTEALPTDCCHPTTSLPKLHPCSRRSAGSSGSHPSRPRRSWFTPGRSCFGGVMAGGGGVFALEHSTQPSPLTSLSRRFAGSRASQPDESGSRSQGCLCARRREATKRQNNQDAFHRKCPERLPP